MKQRTTSLLLPVAFTCAGFAACGDGNDKTVDLALDAALESTADAAKLDESTVDAASEEKPTFGPCSEVFCEDNMILDMSLHSDKVSDGNVENTLDGEDWLSLVDATAGGSGASKDNAFLYLKFTEAGLAKVEIDDETALESTDWDMAARRYLVRLNGGTSGTSCVGAAIVSDKSYAEIDAVPDGLTYAYDQSYDANCAVVDDGSGLPGSPSVALKAWWNYTSCVATTMTPFILELNDGKKVKLVIETYYENDQEACNDSGTPGTGGANLRMRWKYLP